MLLNPFRGIILSPMPNAVMDGPLEVQMSFANMPLVPEEFLAIIYWDTGMHVPFGHCGPSSENTWP